MERLKSTSYTSTTIERKLGYIIVRVCPQATGPEKSDDESVLSVLEPVVTVRSPSCQRARQPACTVYYGRVRSMFRRQRADCTRGIGKELGNPFLQRHVSIDRYTRRDGLVGYASGNAKAGRLMNGKCCGDKVPAERGPSEACSPNLKYKCTSPYALRNLW